MFYHQVYIVIPNGIYTAAPPSCIAVAKVNKSVTPQIIFIK